MSEGYGIRGDDAMSAREGIGWLRREFDLTLDAARQRLNAFAEAPKRRELLADFCRDIHQAAGALAMIRLEGGRVLAEHMEALAEAIGTDQRPPDAEHLEPLMRASLELSDYFDRLAAGLPDEAAVLLPTTNEIRALLDETPFERERLGRPVPAAQAGPVDLAALAAELRPRYQAALLVYYRGAQPGPALARMTGIIGELERAATNPAIFDFLWVVGGVLEALSDGGLGPTLGMKRMLGHVERELKRLEKTSEEALAAHPPQALLDDLLAQVGRARSRGERVTAIRSNFRLAEEVQQAEAGAAGTTGGSELMRSVGNAILEDLERVRDRIDLFVRTGRKDSEALAPLGNVLKKVADALGMLGLTEAQARVERQRESVIELARGVGGDESGLLHLATELIGIESEVETFLLGSGGDPHSAAARAARAAGLRETLAEVARIKNAVTEHLRRGGMPQVLAGLPGRADRVARVLDFLDLAKPASLLRRIACFLERTPTLADDAGTGMLDRLADAVVSVEYYLETLQSGRGSRDSMLENADRALEALGVDREQGTVEARMHHTAPALVPEPSPPAAPAAELASIRGVAEETAIADIFIEEAGEVCEKLATAYPRWRANPADRETLATLRREFHTLKGSGRMAGALRLSEFSRTFEELLDRVLDLALPADHEVVALVGEAVGALPPLLDEFATDAESSVDTAGLMARASTLARSEEPIAAAPAESAQEAPPVEETVPAEAPEGEAVRETPAEPTPRLAPPLYEVYRDETLDHLAVVNAWCEAVERGEETEITPELRRAVHTLVGSARMAGASEMNAVMSPLEGALDRTAVPGSKVGDLAEPVAEAAQLAARLLEAYADETVPLPAWEPVSERLHGLRESLPTPVPKDEAEDTPAEETEEVPSAADEPETEAAAARASPEAEFELSAQASYDAELVQLFAGEAAELLESADGALRAWLSDPSSFEPLSELLRRLHTLKGGARMAGVAPFADLVHDLESLLTRIAEGDATATDANRGLTERSFDRLHRMLERVTGDGRVPFAQVLRDEIAAAMEERVIEPQPQETAQAPQATEESAPADEAPAEAEEAVPEEEERAEIESAGAERPAEIPKTERPVSVDEAPKRPAPAEEEVERPVSAEEAARRAEVVRQRYRRLGLARVRADLLEAAINGAGEVGIYRGRLEQQIVNMNLHLAELERTVDRVRTQLRELEIETEAQMLSTRDLESVERLAEFDPLEFDRYTHIQELSRSLAEAVADLLSLRGLFAGELRQAEASLERQGRINAELQDALLRTRMMPFALSEGRLRRVVRQVAEESGKQVELRLGGIEGEMDRQVLEHVLPALEHVLRNAVVHGIEDTSLRRTRGKPETGKIELALRREGAETLIEISDDGGGLDFAAIRARATADGLIAPDAEPSESELTELIFRPGFSTAGALSQAAGRGVGMDVVATEVRHTGGNVEVRSQAGRGMRVTLRLPGGLAISHALIVRVGTKRYPVPLASVEGIARVTRAELDRLMSAENPVFEFGEHNYELAWLHEILGEELLPAEEQAPRIPLLMTRAGARRAAFIADDMEASREVVVKPVGPQIGRIPGVSGATIFGDGTIALLLDLPGLVRAMPRLEARVEAARAEAARGAEPLVMVVDDSITVRRVTERMLVRHNARVMTAKDGLEALELLADHTPNLVLLDIEMPRMDGYELAERMKADDRLKTVPIIVITSRAGEKHRARAAAIGIERYLGKPYQESELLAAIRSVMVEFNVPAFRAGQ